MARRPHPAFDLNGFSGRFREETARASIVLGAALLEAQLERLFLRRMRGRPVDLLGGSGPLGPFSARIKVAHALGWIDDDVKHDLELIRDIRNDFAHSSDYDLTFDDDATAAKCEKLWVARVLLDAHEHAASAPHRNLSAQLIRDMAAIFKPARQRFEVAVEMLAQHLEELPDAIPVYQGPSLRDALWTLGSIVNIKVSAAGIVGPVPAGDQVDGSSAHRAE